MAYLKQKKLIDEFNKALNNGKLILITAATGYGKTSFINEALKGKNFDLISLKDRTREIKSDADIVVIDDFQFVVDKEYLVEDVINLTLTKKKIVISSRSNPRKYFMESIVKRELFEISEKDLKFTYDDHKHLLSPYLDEEQLKHSYDRIAGNRIITLYLQQRLENGEAYNDELISKVLYDFYDYLKLSVFDFIDPNVLNFLIQISVVDSFTLKIAKAITMNDNVKILIDKAISYGNFISFENGVYHIRYAMLEALRNKSYLYYSDQEYNEFIYNAGHYFEGAGDVYNALKMYEKCNGLVSIKRVLIHNSTMNPASAQFKMLKKYYEMLDIEDVKKYPVLMSGMCMLYALILDIDKSEYYYQLLEERLKTAVGCELTDIENCLDYLDVALPQRGATNMFEILSNQGRRQSKLTDVTPYALTSNNPSIMNGGKDFTMFLVDFKQVIATFGDVMVKSMGNIVGRGLIPMISAECLFEMGADHYTTMQTIVKARMEIDKTELENSFVIARLEILMALETGRIDDAFSIINKLVEECEFQKNENLLKNVLAYRAWLYSLKGDKLQVNKWINNSVNENFDFIATDRFKYLVKIRLYIYLEKYYEAFNLIQKLLYYADCYQRYYIKTELFLLESVLNFLTEKEYIESLAKGLKQAQARNLVRLVSFFGAVMDEMIDKNRDKLISLGVSPEFLAKINPYLLNISTRFPKLYNTIENVVPVLTQTGIMILQLQSKGYTLKQISDRLQLNIETVRYHAKQNYKKLGAAGSAEAVTRARAIGIL